MSYQENFQDNGNVESLHGKQLMDWKRPSVRLGGIQKFVLSQINDFISGNSRVAADRDVNIVSTEKLLCPLTERIGRGSAARCVIVHADDLAITHSVNAAFIQGVEAGLINSGSVMVNCPWFPEIAEYARAHPGADIGVHLTLISERTPYRWGPTAPQTEVKSLVDPSGYLHKTWTPDLKIDPREVEIELRAQIEKAYAAGIRPTHLDSHQYQLQMSGPELFSIFLRLGREYRLPAFVARNWIDNCPYIGNLLTPQDVVVDHTVSVGTDIAPKDWAKFYTNALVQLPSGVTEFVIHPGFDDQELRAFSSDRPTWGAAWRQRDFDFFTSAETRALLETHGINLITWREIAMHLIWHEHESDGRHNGTLRNP